MGERVFVDCTSQLSLRRTYFPCELPHLHEGDHQCTLRGQERRIHRYGSALSVDAETIVRWPRGFDTYTYTHHDGTTG